MTKTLLGMILMSLALACGKGFNKKSNATVQRTQDAQEVDPYEVNQDYLDLLNEYRVDKKLKPLIYSDVIEVIVIEHSKGMAKRSRSFGHAGMNQRCRKIKKRLAADKACGEVVGMGEPDIKSLLKFWLSSPKQQEELARASYTHTALGMYKDSDGVIYWTQIFVEL